MFTQNTNLCESCENRTRVIGILGKPVRVKNTICSEDGVHYRRKPENVQLQLSVCPVSFCPANCRFCAAKGTKTDKRLNIEICDQIALHKPEGQTDRQCNQQGYGDISAVHIEIDRTAHAHQCRDAADGDINAACDHNKRHAAGKDNQSCIGVEDIKKGLRL